MKMIKKTQTSPEEIHNGYTFPNHYAIYGEKSANNLEIDDNNSIATVYLGSRKEIQSLFNEINNDITNNIELLQDDDFCVIGIWDNYINKNNDDYIMLGVFSSNQDTVDLLHYTKTPENIVLLTDYNSSETDAWRSWSTIEYYFKENIITKNDLEKIIPVFFSNITEDMKNNILPHIEIEELKSFISPKSKFKI